MIAKELFVGTAVVASAAMPTINDVTVPLLGVPVAAFMMALLGASFSFAWSSVETSRGKLIFVVLASAFVGATAVGVIPHLVGLYYNNPNYNWPRELQPPLAFLFGLVSPWIVPAFKSAAPTFLNGLGNLILRLFGARTNERKPPDEGET